MHYLTVVVAILSITVIEIYSLSRGVDGTVLLTSIGAIAGLGGYVINKCNIK